MKAIIKGCKKHFALSREYGKPEGFWLRIGVTPTKEMQDEFKRIWEAEATYRRMNGIFDEKEMLEDFVWWYEHPMSINKKYPYTIALRKMVSVYKRAAVWVTLLKYTTAENKYR